MFGKHRTTKIDMALNNEVEAMLRQASEEYDGLLPIVQMGEPVLRRVCARYDGQLTRNTFRKLIDVMRRTMLEAPGVGLAATQIGLGLAFAVMEDHVGPDDEGDPRESAEVPFRVIVNPVYRPVGDATASFYEGCLSFDGYQAVRRRWLDIDAEWDDEHGVHHRERMHGWPARIFQHETDHLSGEVYIDKAEIRSLTNDDNLVDLWCEDPVPTEAARQLGFSL